MTLEEILANWKADCKINQSDLGNESSQVPVLHHKYLSLLGEERSRLLSLRSKQRSLTKLKTEWLLGTISREKLSELGWEPQALKILRQDVPMYLDADPEITVLIDKIQVVNLKIEMLESILKTINNRGFLIKGMVDWVRFTNGLN